MPILTVRKCGGWRIAEIGVGYGALYRLLSCVIDIKKYWMYDLPEVLDLTKKYLSCFDKGKRNVVVYNKEMQPINEEYDVVISNWAFSEVTFNVQKVYMERVIKRAKHGYMIFNMGTIEKWSKGYSAINMLYEIPGARIEPLAFVDDATAPYLRNCCIVVW